MTYSHSAACQEAVTVLLLLKGFLLQFKQEKPKLVEGKVWAPNPADSAVPLVCLLWNACKAAHQKINTEPAEQQLLLPFTFKSLKSKQQCGAALKSQDPAAVSCQLLCCLSVCVLPVKAPAQKSHQREYGFLKPPFCHPFLPRFGGKCALPLSFLWHICCYQEEKQSSELLH